MSKLRRAYLAGLGIINLTYEKAEKMAKEMVNRGDLAREKQQKFVGDLMDKAKKNTEEMERVIKEKIDYLVERGEPLKERQGRMAKGIASRAKVTGKVAEEKVKELVREVMKKAKKIGEKQKGTGKEETDEEKIKDILNRLNIPSQEEIEQIKQKLEELSRKYEQEN